MKLGKKIIVQQWFKVLPGLVMWSVLTMQSGCSQPHLPVLQADDVIVAFGDSLTVGEGVPMEASYPAILQNLSGLKVVNAGISGETTAKGLARFEKVLNDYHPKLVILLEGGNDILQNVAPAQIAGNLKQMIELAQARQIALLLVAVPEKKLFASGADWYDDLAEAYRLPLEGDIVANLMRRPSMKSDYVHFNAVGYEALATAIYGALKDAGAIAH